MELRHADGGRDSETTVGVPKANVEVAVAGEELVGVGSDLLEIGM